MKLIILIVVLISSVAQAARFKPGVYFAQIIHRPFSTGYVMPPVLYLKLTNTEKCLAVKEVYLPTPSGEMTRIKIKELTCEIDDVEIRIKDPEFFGRTIYEGRYSFPRNVWVDDGKFKILDQSGDIRFDLQPEGRMPKP